MLCTAVRFLAGLPWLLRDVLELPLVAHFELFCVAASQPELASGGPVVPGGPLARPSGCLLSCGRCGLPGFAGSLSSYVVVTTEVSPSVKCLQ